MLARELARLLMDSGLRATADGARRVFLHLEDLPEGTRCWLRLDRGAGPRADDPFWGWKVIPRVPAHLRRQAPQLRARILHSAWIALHGAGLLADPPPDRPELVDVDMMS